MTDGLDPAEAVSVILNYVTAYQTLYRSAKIRLGQRVLIHGASGGIGTAFLQLGLLAGVAMYGTVGITYGARAKPSAKVAAWWSTDSRRSCKEEGFLRARRAGGTSAETSHRYVGSDDNEREID